MTRIQISEHKDNINRFITEQRETLISMIKNPEIGGFEICQYNSAIFDAVVKKIYKIARAQVGVEPNIAIFAAGGYGRQELCYLSDIDLCYTSDVDLEEEYNEDTLQFIRVFYNVIDALSTAGGIRPRFSFLYRPYCDASKWNYQDLTSLLDARFLAGNADLMTGLRNTILAAKDDIPLILQLISSRTEHFHKTGDTIYRNQPDIKHGRGGLRDIQFALWIKGLKDFIPVVSLYEQKLRPFASLTEKKLRPLVALAETMQVRASHPENRESHLMAALDFFLKVRNLLHLTAGRLTDILSYNPSKAVHEVTVRAGVQPLRNEQDYTQLRIAEAMGYPGKGEEPMYALMADYYGHAKYLHLQSELIIGDIIEAEMNISEHLGVKQNKIYCIDDAFEQLATDELLTVFEYFQQYDFEIESHLNAHLASNHQRFNVDESKRKFADLLSRGGYVSKTLRRMHQLSVIKHFLPGFEHAMRTRSERPTDPYTVGRHSLEAIAILDDIRNSKEQELLTSFSSYFVNRTESLTLKSEGVGADLKPAPTVFAHLNDIYRQISGPSVLYFALLMHDFDKPGEEHAQTGADKIPAISQPLGFNPRQIEDITFLIREHLTMINIARYHQLNEIIIGEFSQIVSTLERLMMLYLLTYCDSQANGEHNFSDMDKDNLQDLYERTRERFVGKDTRDQYAIVSPERINQFLHQMPVTYRMVHNNIDEIIFQLRLVEQLEAALEHNPEDKTPIIVEFVDKAGYTEMHFCCPDRVGLINQIAGVLYAYDVDAREASIYTKEDTSLAVDTFKLVYKPPSLRESQPSPLSDSLQAEIRQVVVDLMKGKTSLEKISASRGVAPPSDLIIYAVTVEGSRNSDYSEIVVKARERNGLLYLFSGILADLGLNIEMSKCSVLGGVFTNRFYVASIADAKTVESEIRERLNQV